MARRKLQKSNPVAKAIEFSLPLSAEYKKLITTRVEDGLYAVLNGTGTAFDFDNILTAYNTAKGLAVQGLGDEHADIIEAARVKLVESAKLSSAEKFVVVGEEEVNTLYSLLYAQLEIATNGNIHKAIKLAKEGFVKEPDQWLNPKF